MTEDAVTLTLSADHGKLFDGTLDNAAALANQDGRTDHAEECTQVREALWAQDSTQTGTYTMAIGGWRVAVRELRVTTGDIEIDRDCATLANMISAAIE